MMTSFLSSHISLDPAYHVRAQDSQDSQALASACSLLRFLRGVGYFRDEVGVMQWEDCRPAVVVKGVGLTPRGQPALS